MPTIEEISPCPEEFLPDECWIRSTVHAFSELRLSIQGASSLESSKERRIAVPQLKDKKSWFLFCFGDDKIHYTEEEASSEKKVEGHIEIQKRVLAKQYEIPLAINESSGEFEDDEEIESIGNVDAAWTGAVKVPPSTSLMVTFPFIYNVSFKRFYSLFAATIRSSTNSTTPWVSHRLVALCRSDQRK